LRGQRACQSSGHETKTRALDEATPRQHTIEMFHGFFSRRTF
jgi:hypothetical protein